MRQAIMALLPSNGINSANRAAIRLVKIDRCQDFFCQESLTENRFWVENRVTDKFLRMARFGSLAAGALVLSTAFGAAEQADAQATGLTLPHPDGEISIDVSRVAFGTQADILAQLQGCLEAGFTFADADGNNAIEGDEQWDWKGEQAFCAETAERDFSIADSQARSAAAEARSVDAEDRILVANAEQAALRARADEARAAISALTDAAMRDISQSGS